MDVICAVVLAQPTNCTQVRLWCGALCELLASHATAQLSADDVLTPAHISRHVTQLKATQRLSTVQNKHGRLTRLLRAKQGLLQSGASEPQPVAVTAVGYDDVVTMAAALDGFPKPVADLVAFRLVVGLLFGVTGARADASEFNWSPGFASLELDGRVRSTTWGWLHVVEAVGLLPLAVQHHSGDWGEAKKCVAQSGLDMSAPRLRAAWLLEQLNEAQPAAQLLPRIGIRSAAAINRVTPLLGAVDVARFSTEFRGS